MSIPIHCIEGTLICSQESLKLKYFSEEKKNSFQKTQNGNSFSIICELNVREMKTSVYAGVSVCVCVIMRAVAHAQAIQPDQPSASGVIKCDAASGN